MISSLVLLAILLLVLLLLWGRFSPAVLFAAWAVGFYLSGTIEQTAFLAGFTNPAVVTLLLLLLVSLVLERSSFVQKFSRELITRNGSSSVARLSFVSIGLSAFLNNTAVVAGLLGAISKQNRLAPSRLLIPLSYASILGGTITLVGTSTNLVVNSLAIGSGFQGLSMFDFAWVGVPLAVVCGCLIVLLHKRLPNHQTHLEEHASGYFLEARVQAGSALIGRSIDANGLRGLDGLFLLEIIRNGRLISPVTPDDVIEPDDILIFTGQLDKVQVLNAFPGLSVFGGEASDLLASNLIEVVLTHQSELIDKTLREADFRTLFDAGVVGIRRGDKRLTGQLGRIPLKVGDSLILAVGSDFKQRRNLDRNFHILSSEPLRPPLNPWQSRLSLGGFVGVIALAALEVLPLLSGLMVLMGALILSKTLSLDEMRRRFPFELWLMLGSALAIAAAMQTSGASALIAESLQVLTASGGPWLALVGIYLMAMVLTEMVTNTAAAALVFPVALSVAQSLGVDPMPFVMVVAYGASACFLLPFGYQTHLMVYSPGRYKASDFARFGWPIGLAYALIVLVLTPIVFPF